MQPVQHPAPDRGLDRQVVQHQLNLLLLGLAGGDRGLGVADLGLGHRDRGLGAVQRVGGIVEDALRGGAAVVQLGGPFEIGLRHVKRAVRLHQGRLGDRLGGPGPQDRGLGAVQLGRGVGGVHLRDLRAGGQQIALFHRYGGNPPGIFRRHVDRLCLDPAVGMIDVGVRAGFPELFQKHFETGFGLGRGGAQRGKRKRAEQRGGGAGDQGAQHPAGNEGERGIHLGSTHL